MSTNTLKTLATRSIGRSGLILKKYSPEILTGIGIASGVAAGVMAVRATLKVEPVIDDIRRNVATIKALEDEEEVSAQQLNRLKGMAFGQGILELTKLYWPAITLGAASISCVIGAHGIMRKRNAALVVAYNAVEKTFSEYRERVAEKLGQEVERELHLGITEEEVTNEETGKKEIVKRVSPTGASQYARFFDELSQYWSKTPEYNLAYLRAQQNYANDLLQSRGHVFLNEIYDALGLPHTKAGAVVGWVISKDGDNYIDFGIYDPENERAREFVNGYEKAILLDFNVDGVIYDQI